MTLQTPFRLQVMMNLTALLKTVTPANGFVSDLSSSVFRGRNRFGADDPVPMVCILESPHADDAAYQSPAGSGALVGDWPLMLQGFCQDDPDNPTDPAHWLLADVKACLGQERNKVAQLGRRQANLLGMGSAIMDMKIGAGVVRPPDEVSDKAYFWLTLGLEVGENLNPFA